MGNVGSVPGFFKGFGGTADITVVHRLCELFRQLGNSLNLAENLSILDAELHRLVDYDSISVHLLEDDWLAPVYAAGPGFQVLGSFELTVGEGLLGAAAATREPVVNGLPDQTRQLALALALSIEWCARVIAVLAIYRARPVPFTADDLQLLTALAPKLAASIDNAQRFSRAERASTHALFERLDAEVARARRTGGRLAVIACEIEGLDPEGVIAYRVAGELSRLCREYDFVARRDDSFVLTMADFAPAGLAEKQERIQAVFRRHGIAVEIGAAFLPEDGTDAEDLLTAAYQAARADRAQVGVLD